MVSFRLLRRKLNTFRAMRGADRLLVCEAVAMLALARLIVLILPFRYMVPWLSRAPETDSCDKVLRLRVRNAVTTGARNVPWNAACMPQAMTAKTMLARRGCRSALHLGATIGTNGALIAHAWLVSGGEVVIGGAGIPSISPLARFG
jgi:Transglutaminase-like superfamily